MNSVSSLLYSMHADRYHDMPDSRLAGSNDGPTKARLDRHDYFEDFLEIKGG
jgi:hypothetical protein